jgi:hypothetical protein
MKPSIVSPPFCWSPADLGDLNSHSDQSVCQQAERTHPQRELRCSGPLETSWATPLMLCGFAAVIGARLPCVDCPNLLGMSLSTPPLRRPRDLRLKIDFLIGETGPHATWSRQVSQIAFGMAATQSHDESASDYSTHEPPAAASEDHWQNLVRMEQLCPALTPKMILVGCRK